MPSTVYMKDLVTDAGLLKVPEHRTPQNRSLRHKDYFELKVLEKQQEQEGHTNLSFFFLKAGDDTPG